MAPFDVRRRLVSVLGGPRAPWLAVVAAAALTLPGLGAGYMVDDHIHLAAVAGRLPTHPGVHDLYDFADGTPERLADQMDFAYPWWTAPGLKLRFFRPLSSLFTWVDFAVLEGLPWAAHLVSLLWYLAMVLGVGVLLRRTVGGYAAGLAALLYAVDDAHWMPAVWLANRNALVSAAPALWGLIAWLRWREDGWRPGFPLALLGFVTGLLGGETAVGVFALVAAYELLGAVEPFSLLQRLRRLLPMLVLGAIYIATYKFLGYGSSQSGAYVDPTGEPWAFVVAAAARVPALAGAALLGLPVDLWVLDDWTRPPLILGGLLALYLFWRWVPRALATAAPAQRRHTRWLLAGGFLALLPMAATFPSSRVLTVPSLAGTLAVALVLVGGAAASPASAGARGWLIFIHGIVAPVVFVAGSLWVPVIQARFDKLLRSPAIAAAADRTVIVPAPPDPFVGFYAPVVLAALDMPRPRRWWGLSMALHPCTLHRTAGDTVELEVHGGAMVRTDIERLLRSGRLPFAVGDNVRLRGMQATVRAVDDGWPTRVAFQFRGGVEQPGLVWLRWQDGELRPLVLPAVGGSVRLEREVGVVGI
ncbi:MAG: hypothetical protein EXR79_04680 [Myxococcales bacterium]|nr:hypothetical protein [Myxococcales bacterium]